MKNKDKIIEKIKVLKQVEPDEAFVRGTKSLVLNTKPHTRFIPTWAASLVLASVFVLVIASGVILSQHQPSLSSSLNQNSLTKEFNEMDLNMEVEEVTYSQDVHETIASALNEIQGSKTNHMNPSIIKSENKYINQLESTKNEEEIDELLNKVIN